MKIRPLQGQVLVEMLPAEDRDGSILLPDAAQGKPYRAVVREIGMWAQRKGSGKLIAYDFKRGDTVVVSPFTAPIRLLAWELPYATGVALKSKK